MFIRSAHDKSIEFVSIQITKVGGVEAFAAWPGSAFVFAAQRERQLVNAINLSLVLGFQRDHYSVSHRRGSTVERAREPDARAAARLSPGNKRLCFHHSTHIQFPSDGVVELRSTGQIIGSQRDIADNVPLLGPLKSDNLFSQVLMAQECDLQNVLSTPN